MRYRVAQPLRFADAQLAQTTYLAGNGNFGITFIKQQSSPERVKKSRSPWELALTYLILGRRLSRRRIASGAPKPPGSVF